MAVKLDEKQIVEGYEAIKSTCNTLVSDGFDAVAGPILALQKNSDSELLDKVVANCKKAQEIYNSAGYLEGITKVLESYEGMQEIANYLATKADVTGVKDYDASISTKEVDPSAVIM